MGVKAPAAMSVGWVWWRRIFLGASLIAPLLLWAGGWNNWQAWGYAILAHGMLLYGMCWPKSGLLGPITNQLQVSPEHQKLVWLTIDDGPSPDSALLAKRLQERGVQATFFLRGAALARDPTIARLLVDAGHGVANHTMHHPLLWFWCYPPWKLKREVDDCADVFRQAGVQPEPWFRCPAGIKNPFLHSLLRRRELHLAGWTVRAFDGVTCDVEAGVRRILPGLRPGAIILVHEGKRDRDGQPASVEFIMRLVKTIQDAGYVFTKAGAEFD